MRQLSTAETYELAVRTFRRTPEERAAYLEVSRSIMERRKALLLAGGRPTKLVLGRRQRVDLDLLLCWLLPDSPARVFGMDIIWLECEDALRVE